MVTPMQGPGDSASEEQATSEATEIVAAEEEQEDRTAEAPAEDAAALLVRARDEIKALVEERDRLRKQNASYQGNLRQRTRVEDELADLRRQGQTTAEYLDALLGLQGETDPEEIGKKRATLQQRRVQQQSLDDAQSRAANLYRDLVTAAERAGLDPMTAPEFQPVRETWNSAFGADNQIRDMGRMESARRLAENIAWGNRMARMNESQAKPTAAPPKPRPENIAPTATGRPGAVRITDENADELHLSGKISDAQYREFLRNRGILS